MIPYNPVMTNYQPTYSPYLTTAQPAATSAQSTLRFSENVLPRPSGLTAKLSTDEPIGPLVRMRYVELSVSGMMEASDSAKLIATLDKMKGSRGATVKRKGGGEATVKVWYSDKEPLDPDAVIETVAKLGFKAVLAS
jgi:hypothetical protein